MLHDTQTLCDYVGGIYFNRRKLCPYIPLIPCWKNYIECTAWLKRLIMFLYFPFIIVFVFVLDIVISEFSLPSFAWWKSISIYTLQDKWEKNYPDIMLAGHCLAFNKISLFSVFTLHVKRFRGWGKIYGYITRWWW